jgi:hypothetical protein
MSCHGVRGLRAQSQINQAIGGCFEQFRSTFSPNRMVAAVPQVFAIVARRSHSGVARGGESGKMGVPF